MSKHYITNTGIYNEKTKNILKSVISNSDLSNNNVCRFLGIYEIIINSDAITNEVLINSWSISDTVPTLFDFSYIINLCCKNNNLNSLEMEILIAVFSQNENILKKFNKNDIDEVIGKPLTPFELEQKIILKNAYYDEMKILNEKDELLKNQGYSLHERQLIFSKEVEKLNKKYNYTNFLNEKF